MTATPTTVSDLGRGYTRLWVLIGEGGLGVVLNVLFCKGLMGGSVSRWDGSLSRFSFLSAHGYPTIPYIVLDERRARWQCLFSSLCFLVSSSANALWLCCQGTINAAYSVPRSSTRERSACRAHGSRCMLAPPLARTGILPLSDWRAVWVLSFDFVRFSSQHPRPREITSMPSFIAPCPLDVTSMPSQRNIHALSTQYPRPLS